jgi:predicted adenine nucleotide alpha hydrolase (AANH) superfamily ATPase
MLHNGMKPTVFFCNPNIYPLEEYAVRKAEIMRFLLRQEVPFVEDVYDHARWRDKMKGLEGEPERGKRCERCFEFRLRRTAEYAVDNGFSLFTTTLASSRWKDLDQINRAGQEAAATVGGVSFWEQNWRRGGLQDRRGELLLENNFYNQLYCGCEFSLRAREEKVRQKSETNPI